MWLEPFCQGFRDIDSDLHGELCLGGRYRAFTQLYRGVGGDPSELGEANRLTQTIILPAQDHPPADAVPPPHPPPEHSKSAPD